MITDGHECWPGNQSGFDERFSAHGVAVGKEMRVTIPEPKRDLYDLGSGDYVDVVVNRRNGDGGGDDFVATDLKVHSDGRIRFGDDDALGYDLTEGEIIDLIVFPHPSETAGLSDGDRQ